MRKTILFLSVALISTAMMFAQSPSKNPIPSAPFENHCTENEIGKNSWQNDVGGSAGPTGFLLPRGYFHTCGSQIIDEKGNPMRIAAVGWPGYDGNGFVFRGLYAVNWQSTMRGMVKDGFNTIRIPWNDLLITENPPPYPNQINFTLNPDLVGLSGMQIMDKVVAYAGKIGLRIIFDQLFSRSS